MPAMLGLMAALAMLLAAGQAFATEYEVTNKSAVVYAEHDGTKLTGDLYLPKGRAKEHFKKYKAATAGMTTKREARSYSSVAMNMKGM